MHLVTDNCMLHFPAGLNMGWMTYFILLVLTRVSSFAMVIFLYLHGQLYLAFSSRVEVGLDDLENLVTWVIFDGSNKKLNYIFECVPDF